MIKINLLGVKKKKKTNPVVVELLVVFVFLLAYILYFVNVNSSMRSELEHYKSEVVTLQIELKKLQKIKNEIEEFKKKREALQKKIDIVKNLKKGQRGYAPLFINIEKSLPEDVWISNVAYNGNSITINVTSLRSSSVNQFIMNLYKTNMFTNIELKVVKKANVDKIDINNFDIIANVSLGG
ncbi:MAG: PilN domain-containing protein [Calditerrivibrio sp.]|nr:PilN domain-containing protein [Calditerrivibrio sp.]MCA1933609.1 PilN domain-containing protein [Calditerrivibrio sp.]MCA1980636.1 PilN domain-containing protein [Calditerrivibrio sp.]